MSGYRYWAFISYSHRDERWGAWLHRSLERWRTPRALVGRPSRDGTVPSRLFPVFRDREELAASDDLGARIRTALAESRHLVVVCSPDAVRSRWVAEEIAVFRALGRDDRLLCLIVAGEPNVAEDPARSALECLPAALRETSHEPIAADARSEADGRAGALLKVLAGLLGVGYDELRRRDRQRKVRRAMQIVLLTIVAALLGTALWQRQMRRQAITRWVEQGRQELTVGSASRALVYLSAAWQLGERSDPLVALIEEAAPALAERRATLRGHAAWIAHATFSPDGREIATASWDRTVWLWQPDRRAGGPLLPEGLHAGKVVSVDFSPDGQRLVTASWDGFARVWDRAGHLLARLDGHRGRVNSATFAPGGDRIVTASEDATARIWDTSGGMLLPLEGHEDSVKSAAFDARGERIVTASFDRTAIVWDAATGTRLLTLTGHAGPVNTAAFSPDGTRILTASLDRTARVWDAGTGGLLDTLRAHRDRVNSAAFSHDGTLAVTTSDDGTAKVWELASGRVVLSLEGHGGGLRGTEADNVTSAAFSPDDHTIVTAGADAAAMVWDAAWARRTPAAIVALVPERIPWRLLDGRLEPVARTTD